MKTATDRIFISPEMKYFTDSLKNMSFTNNNIFPKAAIDFSRELSKQNPTVSSTSGNGTNQETQKRKSAGK